MSSPKLGTVVPLTRRLAAGRLRRARVARGWSQERAAQELGIGVRTLRDMELGRARMTALEALCALEQETSNSQRGATAGVIVPAAALSRSDYSAVPSAQGRERGQGACAVVRPAGGLLRGGAAVARQAHNLEAGGSNPPLASRGARHGSQGDPAPGLVRSPHETAGASFFVLGTERPTVADEPRKELPHVAAKRRAA